MENKQTKYFGCHKHFLQCCAEIRDSASNEIISIFNLYTFCQTQSRTFSLSPSLRRPLLCPEHLLVVIVNLSSFRKHNQALECCTKMLKTSCCTRLTAGQLAGMWLCFIAGPNNSYPVNLRWTVSSRYRRLIMFDPSILPHSGRSCSCWVFSGGIGTMEAFRALVHLSIDASPQCPPKDTSASFVWLPNNVLSQNHWRSRQFIYNETVHLLTGYVRASAFKGAVLFEDSRICLSIHLSLSSLWRLLSFHRALKMHHT